MDSRPTDERKLLGPYNNVFALVSLLCGTIGVISPFFCSPLLIITPYIYILGFLSGIIALVVIYQPASPYDNARHAWIGCSLCLLAFVVTGFLYAMLGNYAQQALCPGNQHNIAMYLQFYEINHAGYLPSSLTAFNHDIAVDKRCCHRYYFYSLNNASPYIFNGYLAGKNINSFAFPERTIVTAEGTDMHAKLFFTPSALNLRDHGSVTFLDGTVERYRPENFAKHFPGNGKITDDTWFIKPILKTIQKR